MVQTYNPKKVHVSVDSSTVTGFAEDSFISVSPKGEGTTSQTGCDGVVVRAIDVNKQCVIKLVLQQTSPFNKKFHDKFLTDKKDGTGTFTLSIEDANSDGDFSFTVTAWVQNRGEYTRGRNAGNIEWTLETDSVEF